MSLVGDNVGKPLRVSNTVGLFSRVEMSDEEVSMYQPGIRKSLLRDFPGGTVVETPGSQCRGPRFDPWSGN